VPIWTFDEHTVGKICNSFFENEIVAQLRVKNYLGETLFDNSKYDDSELVEKLGKIIHDGNDIGSIEIALTLQLYKENNLQLLKSSMISMLVTILMIIGVTTILLKLFLRNPLDYLYDRIDRIAEGDYEYKTQKYNQREIETIISKFNDMAERVQNREKSLSEINVRLKREIDERKSTEEAFLESEDRYRASGFSETERVKKAQKLGAGAYIKKPYVLEKMGIAVRAELDKLS
jgi:methyl-accepting chemotaxis protein